LASVLTAIVPRRQHARPMRPVQTPARVVARAGVVVAIMRWIVSTEFQPAIRGHYHVKLRRPIGICIHFLTPLTLVLTECQPGVDKQQISLLSLRDIASREPGPWRPPKKVQRTAIVSGSKKRPNFRHYELVKCVCGKRVTTPNSGFCGGLVLGPSRRWSRNPISLPNILCESGISQSD
jgi:hypothetical protein